MSIEQNLDFNRKETFYSFRRAIAVVCGTVALSGCTTVNQPISEQPDAVERQELVFCYSEKPNCNSSDVATGEALAVIGTGNSVNIESIPEPCTPNGVEKTLDKELPYWLIEAAISVEDKRFCSHDGRDIKGLARAFFETINGNKQGGSSIDMQALRCTMPTLTSLSDIDRKLYELQNADDLNDLYTKKEIMKLYLNNCYFGRGAYGVEAAAQAYFGVTAKELSIDQAATIIALLQNPGKYEGSATDPKYDAESYIDLYNERNEVLITMWENGFRDPDNLGLKHYAEAELNRVPFSQFSRTFDMTGAALVGAEFAVFQIINDLNRDIQSGVEEGKLPAGASIYDFKTINTTISKFEQEKLHNSYVRHSNMLALDGRQFGAVIVDETGAITAYIPGVYNSKGPNIDLLRSPIGGGSQDKPYFIASLLLVEGYSPDTIISDPEYFEWLNYDGFGNDYKPNEKGNRCRSAGSCSLRESVAYSSNWGPLLEIKKLEHLGIPILKNTFKIMDSYGVERLYEVGPAGYVGASEIKPVHRAIGAMQLYGLRGRAIPQINRGRMKDSVIMQDGTYIPLYDSSAGYQQIVPVETADQLIDILSSAVEYGTAKRLGPASQKTHVIAKTGTVAGKSGRGNVAAGVNGTFCAYDGKNRSFAVIMTNPNGLIPMDLDADGGRAPTLLINDTVIDLSSEYCLIND